MGSFTSHKNQISESTVRCDLWFFVLIQEDYKGHYQRQHFLLSYLKTLGVGQVAVFYAAIELIIYYLANIKKCDKRQKDLIMMGRKRILTS